MDNKCSCGHNHLKGSPNDSEEKNAHILIRADRVKEIQLKPNGLVKILLVDDNNQLSEELEINFENSIKAENWIKEKFGKYI
jgi:hypothetical protein